LGSVPASNYSVAFGINDAGQVVGKGTSSDGIQHAIVWNGSTPTAVGAGYIAYAINGSGQVVGISDLPNLPDGEQATIWNGNIPTYLSVPGLTGSVATAINNVGQVVGYAGNQGYHAIIWNGTTPTDLSALNGNAGMAFGINNSGQVAGVSYPSGYSGLSQATIWNGTTPTVLGTLGGVESVAQGINNAGQVVGWSYTTNQGTQSPVGAFIWTSGTMSPLANLPGSNYGNAYAINDLGQVVGDSSFGQGSVATLWNNGIPVNLNTMLDYSGNGWQLTEPLAINNLGQIVGYGEINGVQEAFLLTPNYNALDHWVNTHGGDWSTAAANWNSGLPTTSVIADIDATGTYSVAITTNVVAYGLWVNDAQATVSDNSRGSLALAGSGGAANPNGSLKIDAGTFVLNGGTFKAGTIFVDSGGTFLISSGSYTGSNALSETITNNGSLTDNTMATITGNVSGTGSLVIAGKGVLEVGGSVSENITFASGSSGTFKLDHSLTAPFTGTIFGLTPKDAVDLVDLTYVRKGMTATYNSSAGTLTISNGGQSVALKLAGNFTNATWVLSKDASGGTMVVDPPAGASGSTTVVDPPASSHSLSDQIAQFGAGNGSSWSAADPTLGRVGGGLLARTNGAIPDIAALAEQFKGSPLVSGGASGLLSSSLTAEEQRAFLAFNHG
jgi:probable HAF family extracellular repeat protein